MFTLCNSHHPQKLVDVVSAVADHASKDHQNIVHVQGLHNFKGGRLVATHRHANEGNMTIVPGVIVDQGRSIGHTGNLVSVIPPGHHACLLVRVLSQPIVGFAKVVQDVTGSVYRRSIVSGWQIIVSREI